MTRRSRPDTVVYERLREPAGRGRPRRASVMIALAAAAVAGMWVGFGLRRGPPVLAAGEMASGEIPFFGYCPYGGGANCVVDGNTFYFRRDKVRIAGIDAPETYPPRCAAEAGLGEAATHRLRDLLNAGEVTLSRIEHDEDIYGHKLRTVAVGGADVGAALVGEGLARDYAGGRKSWCA